MGSVQSGSETSIGGAQPPGDTPVREEHRTPRVEPICRRRKRACARSREVVTIEHHQRGSIMGTLTYEKEITALLVIDPYNDFISEGGKLWDRVKTIAEANNCVPHMLQVLNAAREAGLRVFYALHHRY